MAICLCQVTPLLLPPFTSAFPLVILSAKFRIFPPENCYCENLTLSFVCFFFFIVIYKSAIYLFILLFRIAPTAYGCSQAGSLIGAAAASLYHSNTGSEPSLQPTPQLTATPDPEPTERGQRSNLQLHGS